MRTKGILAGPALLAFATATVAPAMPQLAGSPATAPIPPTAVTVPGVPGPLAAPTAAPAVVAGAPIGAPMQPGGWTRNDWQPGNNWTQNGYQPGGPSAAAQMASAPMRSDQRRPGHRHHDRGMPGPDVARDPAFAVVDWQAWGLTQPGAGMHWARYYDDAILVDAYGTVVDVRHGVNWAGPRPYPATGVYPPPPPGAYAGYPVQPGTTVRRTGPNTVVTTRVVVAPSPVVVGAPGYGYGGNSYAESGYPGGGVVVTPGNVITTTTTTTTTERVYRKHAVRRRPIRHRIVH